MLKDLLQCFKGSIYNFNTINYCYRKVTLFKCLLKKTAYHQKLQTTYHRFVLTSNFLIIHYELLI